MCFVAVDVDSAEATSTTNGWTTWERNNMKRFEIEFTNGDIRYSIAESYTDAIYNVIIEDSDVKNILSIKEWGTDDVIAEACE